MRRPLFLQLENRPRVAKLDGVINVGGVCYNIVMRGKLLCWGKDYSCEEVSEKDTRVFIWRRVFIRFSADVFSVGDVSGVSDGQGRYCLSGQR
jgi:hypothetical protein